MDQSQSRSCMTSAVIKASCLLHLFGKSTEDGSLVKFASVVFNIELDRLYLQRTISHQRPWLILQGNTSTPGKSKKISLPRGKRRLSRSFLLRVRLFSLSQETQPGAGKWNKAPSEWTYDQNNSTQTFQYKIPAGDVLDSIRQVVF